MGAVRIVADILFAIIENAAVNTAAISKPVSI